MLKEKMLRAKMSIKIMQCIVKGSYNEILKVDGIVGFVKVRKTLNDNDTLFF